MTDMTHSRPARTLSALSIRAASLLRLHERDGDLDLSGVKATGFANAWVRTNGEGVPGDRALRPFAIISTLDRAIDETPSGRTVRPGKSPLPSPEYDSPISRREGNEQRSAQDVMHLINEEIGEQARRNPGQRQRLARASILRAAPRWIPHRSSRIYVGQPIWCSRQVRTTPDYDVAGPS